MVQWPDANNEACSASEPTTTLDIRTRRGRTIRKFSWDGRLLNQMCSRVQNALLMAEQGQPAIKWPNSRAPWRSKRRGPRERGPSFMTGGRLLQPEEHDSVPEALGLRNWSCHSSVYSARRMRRPVWSCNGHDDEQDAIGLRNWRTSGREPSVIGLAQVAMYRAAQNPEAQLKRLEVDRLYSKIQEADLVARLEALKLEDDLMVSWPPAGMFPVYGDADLEQYPDPEDCIPVRRTDPDGKTWDHPDNALAYDCGALGEEIATQNPVVALYIFQAMEQPEETKLDRDHKTWDHPDNALAYDCAKLAEEMASWDEYEDWDLLNEEELDFEGGLLEEGPSVYGCTLGELPEGIFNGELLDGCQVQAPPSPVVVRPTREELNQMTYKNVRELARVVGLGRKFGTKGQFINDLLTQQEGWELL